jgi:Fe-S-cluster-containing dehydrogenase component
MGITKREFFKLAGLTALAAGGKPAGRRWAMVIDLRIDTDWAPSIQACHRVHNVPDFVTNPDPTVNNPRHEIKWLWTAPYRNAFDVTPADAAFVSERMRSVPIPLLCNHCDNPPCVRACPTQATFKRSDGIVVMDYHRCIGCRFCMAACPYGSRSFNLKDPRLAFKDPQSPAGWTPPNPEFPTRMKGVVEKCNFCSERIEVGLPPACVEACVSKAMTFGDLNERGQALPGGVAYLLANNYAIKRKPELGTLPMIYYLV